MKKILVALLLLTIIPAGALAQSNPPLSSKRIRLQGQAAPPTPNPPTGYYNLWVDSATGALNITDSAGTDTPVGAGITGLTTGVVPQAGSATTIVNSKMTTSGTNSGTWTLYDDTGGTGLTKLALREGPGQGSTSIIAAGRASDGTVGFEVGFGGGPQATVRSDFFVTTGSNVYLDTYNLRLVSGLGAGSGQINWNVGPSVFSVTTVALYSPAPGILAVTDGSTGWGSLRAANVGVQTANGAISNIQTISESITLNTGGTTTDSSADLLPANSIILSVAARVTTTITTATDWNLQDPTTANRFLSPNSTLTAGTTAVGLNHLQGGVATDGAGPVQIAAAKLRIVTTGTPGAGVIRVTVTYLSLTPPTS